MLSLTRNNNISTGCLRVSEPSIFIAGSRLRLQNSDFIHTYNTDKFTPRIYSFAFININIFLFLGDYCEYELEIAETTTPIIKVALFCVK